MKKIVGRFYPFEMEQKLYVLEDGDKLKDKTISAENISKEILSLSLEFDVHDIDLVGPKAYLKGLVHQIQEEEIKKYSKNTLNINII